MKCRVETLLMPAFCIVLLVSLLSLANLTYASGKVSSRPSVSETVAKSKFDLLAEDHSSVCMNLIGTNDWTEDDLFKDEMRSARAWIATDTAHGWSNGNEALIPLRADGYPAHVPFDADNSELDQTVVSVISSTDMHAGGVYHVLYSGTGDFSIQGNVDIISDRPGELIVNAKGGEKLLAINRSDASNPLRDFQIVRKEDFATYEGQPFNERFARTLGNISVLRLMDLMYTNGNTIEHWSDRTPYGYYSWNAKTNGYPPQVLMRLVNHLEAVPWINIPHMADDEFVRNYAEIVYKTLNPNSPVVIEYSNEVWNELFQQTKWTRTRGCANGLTRVLNEDNSQCAEYLSGIRYQTLRSLEILSIFNDVFGDQKHRIMSVIATQSDVPWRTEQALIAMEDPSINPDRLRFDAIAVAPYFGSYIDDQLSRDDFVQSSLEQLKQKALDIMGGEVRQGIEDHKRLADKYSMDLVAYEGGQHFLSSYKYHDDQLLQDKLAEFNGAEEMGDLYTEYLDTWFEIGGGLFCVFSHVGAPSRWGAWGTMEHLGQNENDYPKYKAVMKASRKYAPVQVSKDDVRADVGVTQ